MRQNRISQRVREKVENERAVLSRLCCPKVWPIIDRSRDIERDALPVYSTIWIVKLILKLKMGELFYQKYKK